MQQAVRETLQVCCPFDVMRNRMQVFNVSLRLKAAVRMSGMVRKLRSLGALVLTIVAGLAAAQGVPSLGGYDRETRQSMELACVSEKVNGPVAYGACLNRQIASMQDSHDTISSQSPSQTSESQPQRASKRSSQSSSQVNATRPQTAPARPAKSAPAVGTTLWHEAIPFVILLVALSVYLAPTIWVLASSRSRGGAKFGWFIVSLCFSWLGLAAFLIFTQASRNRPNT
jgi:hypothetical protein